MRGKIDIDGNFMVYRKDGETELYCPFAEELRCGTWCPHFSEPIKTPNDRLNRTDTLVHICHNRYWKFTGFEDERGSSTE